MNIETINETNELKEIADETREIKKYKNELLVNNHYNDEIQQFIGKVTNKYRYKLEVRNYYSNKSGEDEIYGNQYNTLCLLEGMIRQYAILKYGEDVSKRI